MIFWPKFCRSTLVVFILVASTIVGAQQDRKGEESATWPRPPRSVRLQMDIGADSALVRGTYELDYANEWGRPVERLCFRLSRGWRISVDSILYLNAPLQTEAIQSDTMLVIPLDVPITPQSRGYFMIVYSAIPSSGIDNGGLTNGLDLWGAWPVLCRQSKDSGVWLSDLSVGAVADYDVGITLDTSLILAHSGELLDEQHVYGLLPRPEEGERFHDLLAMRDSLPLLAPYRPQPAGPSREFFVRCRDVADLSLMIAGGCRIDRAKVDSATVTVYRPGDIHTDILGLATEIYPVMAGKLGVRGANDVALIVADSIHQPSWDASALLIPTCLSVEKTAAAAIAFEMARHFLPLPDSYATHTDGVCRWNGAAYFLAAETLHELYGAAGYDMVTQYEDKLFRERGPGVLERMGCTAESAPLIFQEAMYWRGWQMAQENVMRYSVWEALTRDLSPGPTAIDYRFRSIEKSSAEAVVVTVAPGDSIVTPVQLGVTFNGRSDTVYIETEGLTRDTCYWYDISGFGAVSSVTIDPNYHVYDVDRSNNYWHQLPVREHHHLPDDVFPALRRLK